MATIHSQSTVGYAPAPGTYALDTTHSYVSFTARHLMVTKVRGRFPVTAGELVIAENPSQSRAATRSATSTCARPTSSTPPITRLPSSARRASTTTATASSR